MRAGGRRLRYGVCYAMSEGPAPDRPQNNVYTVLLILATVVVAGATVYLAVRSQQLFGSWNPFGGA